MRRSMVLLFVVLFPFAALAASRNNDDTCDIAVMPAATLLLPYFEVSPSGDVTTVWSVTNTTPEEQIAHVTLWTDYSYPVLDFNIYLTCYDIQSINMWDILWEGAIAPDRGTGTDVSDRGEFSTSNARLDVTNCGTLPGYIPSVYTERMQSAFTLGIVPPFGSSLPGCSNAGSAHTNAIGYVTIDVVRACTVRNATSVEYFTEDLLWDNVLLGDYQQVERHPETNVNYSEGGSMVHIRAITEGGTAAERREHPSQYEVPFHRTFYSRYLPADQKTFDARQPLPSLFGARWIGGEAENYDTYYKVWREPVATPTDCASYAKNFAPITDFVLFDEDENAQGFSPDSLADPPGCCTPSTFPSTRRASVRDHDYFPRQLGGAVSGWMYLNLDTRKLSGDEANQAWVIVNLRSGKDLSVDLDAAVLGNGCTPRQNRSQVLDGSEGFTIRPPANLNP